MLDFDGRHCSTVYGNMNEERMEVHGEKDVESALLLLDVFNRYINLLPKLANSPMHAELFLHISNTWICFAC
jgi:hypothetical protein